MQISPLMSVCSGRSGVSRHLCEIQKENRSGCKEALTVLFPLVYFPVREECQ